VAKFRVFWRWGHEDSGVSRQMMADIEPLTSTQAVQHFIATMHDDPQNWAGVVIIRTEKV
jgi:hypothetical protein